MQNLIIPHLWFDREAREATQFYTSLFSNSKITHTTTLYNTPSGDCDIVSFKLAHQPFMAISAGPLFKFNPSISLLVYCESKEEAKKLWEKLLPDGSPLMELATYPFSKLYGWIEDKYGLSWQVMFKEDYPLPQKIVPTFMFVGTQCGRAEEAIRFYTSIFPNSHIPHIDRYEKGEEPNAEGSLKHALFVLEGQPFAVIDSAYEHNFAFNEAISLIVNCHTQKEIDNYWEKLSAFPEAEQCGWLKDKYGLSWQIVPSVLNEMLQDQNKKKVASVTQAFLKMKKFNINELKKAYEL